MNNFERAITWMRRIDDLLAGEGVHTATLADELCTSIKTIRRAIDGIKSQGLDVESVRVDDEGQYWYVYRYVDRGQRLFAKPE